MRHFLLFVFITCNASSFAQIMKEAAQKELNQKFAVFVPKDYIIIDTAESDFNNDGLKDIAMVLDPTDSSENAGRNRAVSVLQKTKNGYIQSVKGNTAVLCYGCGGIFGDPYAGISFVKNVLTINHYGGSSFRWSSNFTFRFQNNQWELIGLTYDSNWINGECNNLEDAARNLTDINFSTRKMHIIKTDDNSCKPKVNKWVSIKSCPKITLSDFDPEEDYSKQVKY